MSDADRNDELAALRDLGRHVGHPETLETPPAGLWDRIAAEAGLPSTAAETVPDATVLPDATVTELPRRVPRSVWILSAAAAVVVIAVIGAAMFRGANDGSIVATATLDRLQGESAEGTAELHDLDGAMQLQLQASGLDAGDGFLEVWMIDPDVTQLVSLGPLRPDGTYDLPEGMDAGAFPIVDVSFESFDGDPTHSGDSVLRGQLEF